MEVRGGEPGASVALWWLPVGAGGHVVIHTSRWWEAVRAWRGRRPRRSLFHAALEVEVGSARTVIEMAPAWGNPGTSDAERGVVATGPVGMRWLGASRLFRYEVRRWEGGDIPDRDTAPAPPTRLQIAPARAQMVLDRVGDVPRHVWGRDPLGMGDMWNSNSLIAWLLESCGVGAASHVPPAGGDAPGWRAGIAAATLQRGE